MSYCIYLRKSRADRESEAQGEQETLARHEKLLTDFAIKNNLKIDKIYREVVSGENIASRPEMQNLLNDVDNGLYDGVLVVEVERLARGDTKDQGIVAESFKYSNTKIITPSKIYDPNNEFDEEYFEFGLFMSRREYKTINRRLQRGRLASVNEGKYVGNVAPYGYERQRLNEQKGFTLVEIKEEADVVRLIFKLYVYGINGNERIGVSKICHYLNKLKIKPRKSEIWVNASIQTILRNPVYVGKIKWNSRAEVKKIVNGKIVKTRPRASEYTIVDGLHKAIIDTDTFNLAQEYINSNRARPVNERYITKNPLSGLIQCGLCGRLMVRRPYPNRQPSLMCAITECNNVSSDLADVEESLIELLQDWLNRYTINWQAENIDTTINDTAIINSSLDNLIADKNTLLKQLDSLQNLLEQGVYDVNTYLSRSNILNDKINTLTANITELEEKISKTTDYEESCKNLIPKIRKVIELYYKTEDMGKRNELLKEVLEKAVYVKLEKNPRGDKTKKYNLVLYPKLPKK